MRPQVLVYGHRKQPDKQFYFTTKKEKEAAFLRLFNYMRTDWKVYTSGMTKAQKQWYDRAMMGQGVAAIQLLTLRRKYEYEQWHIEPVPAKAADRVSVAPALKPYWIDVKQVRVRREASYVPSVTLVLANHKELNFLLVPHMATHKDWDDLNAASVFITDSLTTEWEKDLHNGEGLKKALAVINELRHAVYYALYPETASEKCTPERVIERSMQGAESFLSEYSNTPIEELKRTKRRPTTLEEANEELAKAKRTIGSLSYYLKQAGKEKEVELALRD